MNAKTDEEIPVRFELSINGKYIATGGVRHSVFNIILNRIAREPGSCPAWSSSDEEDWYREEIDVSLGGMDKNDHIRWVEGEPLQVGDEVLVRVLGPGKVDEPISRTNRDEAYRERHQPVSSDGTRETELKESTADFENAQISLLGNLNATAEEFERSRERLDYAVNKLLGALIGAESEIEGDNALAFKMQGGRIRNVNQVFLGILLNYRERLGLTDADKA